MAQIYPFRSLQYALDKIPIEKVVTQPYDKISKDMQERYYAQHPNNIVRLVFGKSFPNDSPTNNVYTRSAADLNDWRRIGVLQLIPEPAFFIYFQRFTLPDTHEVRVRKGFVGLGRLEDYSSKVVFPHERTLLGPKKDRLVLLRHTKTQFEQIFMLYDDPACRIDALMDEVARQKPDIHLKDEYDVEHTLWTLTNRDQLEFIQAQMAGKTLIIADGHHRYETALAFRDELHREHGSDRIPMTFFNMSSPGLTVLPTHRLLSNVPEFDSRTFFNRAAEYFDSSSGGGVTIGVFTNNLLSNLHLKSSVDLAVLMPDLSAKQRTLDVVILHRLML